MNRFNVYQTADNCADIDQLSIKREWMDQTFDKHAYHCFPVSTANTLGYQLSFPKDISFIWNGDYGQGNKVDVLEGNEYVYTGRENGTLSFHTNLVFSTDEDYSIFMYTPPNYFRKEFETISTVISTSFYKNELPVAIRIKEPNVKITIKAGEPFVSLIPLSLSNLDKIEMNVFKGTYTQDRIDKIISYGNASQEINKVGKWTDWYRQAVNEKGESEGSHEVKNLKLIINRSNDEKELN